MVYTRVYRAVPIFSMFKQGNVFTTHKNNNTLLPSLLEKISVQWYKYRHFLNKNNHLACPKHVPILYQYTGFCTNLFEYNVICQCTVCHCIVWTGFLYSACIHDVYRRIHDFVPKFRDSKVYAFWHVYTRILYCICIQALSHQITRCHALSALRGHTDFTTSQLPTSLRFGGKPFLYWASALL